MAASALVVSTSSIVLAAGNNPAERRILAGAAGDAQGGGKATLATHTAFDLPSPPVDDYASTLDGAPRLAPSARLSSGLTMRASSDFLSGALFGACLAVSLLLTYIALRAVVIARGRAVSKEEPPRRIDSVRRRRESKTAEGQLAEDRIREQAAHISAILDSAIDAIITIDGQGSIESVNPAAERMFGYPADEMLGQNVKLLMPPPYRGDHDQYLRNYVESSVAKVIGIGRQVVGVRKDGGEFPIDLAVTEVEIDGQRTFTGVVRDLTERKRSENELLAANAELQRRAASIEKFNNLLARSNDDLKQFAYVASHDLQEPLRKVISFCELLRDEYGDRLDGDALTYIDYAVSGARRMRALVNDLLDYSRVETQGKPLAATPAEDALAEAISNLELAIQESQVTIEHERLPTIAADRSQLVRLFQNLIGNAIKYRSEAPPYIRVWAEEQNGEWVFHVQDNGLGVDPQYHARSFVIFQRLHTREAYADTGIGLAVCKRIVERFGGRIWVKSSLGNGCDFCFALPKSAVQEAEYSPRGQNHERHHERRLVQTN